MDTSPEPITRRDLEEFGARLHASIERSAQTLRAEIEQSAQALRKDIGHVDKSVAGIAGELRILKWAVSLALAAIVGGLGMLYQGVTDLRTEMYRGDNALREEIADLGERTARLEEGQRHTHERLRNLTDLTRVRGLAPGAGGVSGNPS